MVRIGSRPCWCVSGGALHVPWDLKPNDLAHTERVNKAPPCCREVEPLSAIHRIGGASEEANHAEIILASVHLFPAKPALEVSQFHRCEMDRDRRIRKTPMPASSAARCAATVTDLERSFITPRRDGVEASVFPSPYRPPMLRSSVLFPAKFGNYCLRGGGTDLLGGIPACIPCRMCREKSSWLRLRRGLRLLGICMA